MNHKQNGHIVHVEREEVKMKKLFKRSKRKVIEITGYMTMVSILLIANAGQVMAAEAAPKFDNAEAQTVASGWLDPFSTFLLWAVPVLTTVAILVAGIVNQTRDEDTRESKPFKKTAKHLLIVGIVCEFISIIMKIIGLSS